MRVLTRRRHAHLEDWVAFGCEPLRELGPGRLDGLRVERVDLHASLDAVRLEQAGAFGFAEALLDHAKDNLRLFRAVVGRRGGQHLLGRFRDVVHRLVEADLKSLGVDERDRAVVARYVGGGFVEMMTAWLERPSAAEPSVLASSFQKLTSGVLSSVGVRGSERATRVSSTVTSPQRFQRKAEAL